MTAQAIAERSGNTRPSGHSKLTLVLLTTVSVEEKAGGSTKTVTSVGLDGGEDHGMIFIEGEG